MVNINTCVSHRTRYRSTLVRVYQTRTNVYNFNIKLTTSTTITVALASVLLLFSVPTCSKYYIGLVNVIK